LCPRNKAKALNASAKLARVSARNRDLFLRKNIEYVLLDMIPAGQSDFERHFQPQRASCFPANPEAQRKAPSQEGAGLMSNN